MKKTLQLLLFSALSVGAVAQHKTNPLPLTATKAVQELHLTSPRSSRPFNESGNRNVIFHETFENGFNGTTEYGAWTYEHYVGGVLNTQGTQWSIGQPGYENVYGGPQGGFPSASPQNWALWDGAAYCEEYPTECNAQGGFYTAHLYAPVLDCSEMNSVLVSFQQVFRWCCLIYFSPYTLDVSVDDGLTWASFDARGGVNVPSNSQSPTPLNTTIDISCIAAGEANVRIRFSYNSEERPNQTHYYWGIDEVKVFENDVNNNLTITDVFCGDIFNSWEFRVTPEEEINPDGMVVGARVSNKGYVDHDNVQIRFELVDTNGETAYEYLSEPIFLYGASNDTICPHTESIDLLFQTDIVPAVGTYTLRATIVTDLEEDGPGTEDNVYEEVIVFNNIGEFGHDPDDLADFDWSVGTAFVTGSQVNRERGGWGSFFSFINPNTAAHGITVRFGSTTVAGVEFTAALLNGDGELVASGNYETREGYNSGEPLYFAFNGPFPVGGVYPAQPYTNIQTGPSNALMAALWRQSPGVGQLSVRAEETDDVDYSSVSYERSGDGNWVWFPSMEYNFGVRLITQAGHHVPVNVDEINNTASFSVYPNPAVNETRVSFNLAESKFIAYEVRDLQGRLMDTDNVGRFGAGENSFSLNVSNYPAGNYIVGLVIDGKQMITQQFSVVR